MTLGGVLSVRLTVTLCECCWERVAIRALTPSFSPLFLPSLRYSSASLPSCLSILLFPAFLSLLAVVLYNPQSIQHFIFLSDPPPAFPSLSSSSSPSIFTFPSQTATLNLPVGILASAFQSGSRLGQELKGDYRSREGGSCL